MITISNLSKYYQNKNQQILALDNINLQINAGEIFGIIGKSGAGKSTLIRCVNLLEKPSFGKVVINGVDLNSLSSSKLRFIRRHIGMVFQHFNLLESRTVFENIALPLELAFEDNINERVNEYLELVGLTDRANCYPSSLSGGQKQRVAIARALITKSKILLCDEITSALDPESTISILQLLKKINKELNITILLITHEMEVIKNICDRVGVLDNGSLVEQNNVRDLFVEPKSAATKKLVQNVLHLELPNYLQERLKKNYTPGTNPIVRLVFIGRTANEPVITDLFNKFQVSVNILQADMEQIHEAVVGFMLCKLIGSDDYVASALNYLKNLNIKVEVIGYE